MFDRLNPYRLINQTHACLYCHDQLALTRTHANASQPHQNQQMYPDVKAYHSNYTSLSPPKAKDALAALQSQVPWDLVRRYLLGIAPGPVSGCACLGRGMRMKGICV